MMVDLSVHLFILPTFLVSFTSVFPCGGNRYVFPLQRLIYFFGNKIHRTQQNQTSIEEEQIY